MNSYIIFNLNDPRQEPITSWCANSLSEAEQRFAQIKRLPLEQFKQIYGVCKIDK